MPIKKLILCSVILLCSSNLVYAYELDGDAYDNGDGTYSVTLQNQYGHEYDGEADKNDDGTLDVSVEDSNNESYSGTATPNDDGTYDLELQNDSSGGNAEGTLEIDQ
jgi:hypothetical protein